MTEHKHEEGEPTPTHVEWPGEDGEWCEVFDDEDLGWWNWEEGDNMIDLDDIERGEHPPEGYPANNKKFAEKVQEQLRRDDKADQFRLNMSRFATSLRKDSSAQILLDEHQMDSIHTFEEGRNSERAAVVAWLRQEAEAAAQTYTVQAGEWANRIDDLANCIERGEHRREEGE